MDIAGFNYRPHKYQENYKKLPQQIVLGSETASTVSSRGVYKFPVTRQWMKKYDDHQSSSYDVESCSWSNLPEDDFIQHEDLPYCIGAVSYTHLDVYKRQLPVKSVLRKGENHLYIYFHSPIRQTLPQYASNGFNYPADNDHHEKHLSVFSRKAPYSYGWDWGIRMVTSGVWRPVTLRFYDIATISDYHVRQLSLTDENARLSNELIVNQIVPQKIPAEVRVNVSLNGTTVTEVKQQVTLQPGINHITLPAEVTNPVRWMPNGWGTPTLYDFSAQIACGRCV